MKIALITMDSIDQHWVTLNEGAQAAAAELGVTVDFMAPNTKDDAQQIECVNNAVAGGYNAIIVAANGPDAISSALKEASSAGVKIVYVDSPANVDAEATFSTDNKAAGTTAGQEMIKALTAAGTTSGDIGIVNVNAATDSCVMREEGSRAAFEGSGFNLLETQYGEGDAAKSQSIAENYITQGVVGIFGCNEGSTTGTGNAIKAAGNSGIVGVGFDKSDAIQNLISDGHLLCTMAQNPDVMGYEGVKAAVADLSENYRAANQKFYADWQHVLLQSMEETVLEAKQTRKIPCTWEMLQDNVLTSAEIEKTLLEIVDPLWCDYAERRFYAARFLEQAAVFLPKAKADLAKAMELFDEIHNLMYAYIAKVDRSAGTDFINVDKFRDSAVRREMAAIVEQCRLNEQKAVQYLKRAED